MVTLRLPLGDELSVGEELRLHDEERDSDGDDE